MKRVGGLWPEIVSFSNLLIAAEKAAAGKRARRDVAAFLINLEVELLQLQRDLTGGYYRPGAYRSFKVQDPKPRLILRNSRKTECGAK